MKTNDIAAVVAVSLNKMEKNKYFLQDLGPLLFCKFVITY